MGIQCGGGHLKWGGSRVGVWGGPRGGVCGGVLKGGGPMGGGGEPLKWGGVHIMGVALRDGGG